MKPRIPRSHAASLHTARRALRVEHLESRIAPAFVASIIGLEATMTGDASDESLFITANGATLAHNRFTAGDPGFASDLDFDSTTPGEQTFPAVAGSRVTVDLGAGEDTFGATGNIASIAALRIFGGAGDDTLLGSNGVDLISGGPGRDFIDGQQGNDTQIGGDGDDTIQWDPGDGSDIVEGGAGADTLLFNGSAGSETFTFSELTNRLLFTRNLGNIAMDVGTVETVELNALGNFDTINVNNLAATDVRHVRIHLAATFGTTIPDAQVDTINLLGTSFDDDIRVRNSGAILEVTGLAVRVQVDGFDPTDILNVSGAGGVDNVAVTAAAGGKMVVNPDGESEESGTPDFQLSTPAGHDVGRNPAAIAFGHLLGAGRDLVVANTKDNSVSVLFNSGDGTFLPAVQLPTGGKAPKSVALGDLNGDGTLDIAVTNSGSANVSVLLNNGDGTFAAPALFATGKSPGKLRTADLNADGVADLIMISAGNKLSVLAGDGNGGFAAPASIATGGSAPVDFVLTDFNSDGRDDLAIAHAGSAGVTVLTANADGTFGAPLKLRTGTKPSALAVGDFNGDGRDDLAVTHSVSRFVTVLLNASTGGTAAFNPLKLAHPGNNAPATLAVADLDRDGRDDLIVGNTASGSLSILLNAGAATFRPALRIDLDNSPPRKTSALVVADFNNDGRLDIAAANAGTADVSVVFGLRG